MMKIRIKCFNCDKQFEQEVEYISQIDWICPECKSSEHTATIDIETNEPDETPIIMGKGGCGKQSSW